MDPEAPSETPAEKFVREFFEGLPLLPRLQALAKQIDREYEVLTTLWFPERDG